MSRCTSVLFGVLLVAITAGNAIELYGLETKLPVPVTSA